MNRLVNNEDKNACSHYFKLGSEKMKVFKTIFLCVVLVFALAGCGNSMQRQIRR